jgi:hypothetical protein
MQSITSVLAISLIYATPASARSNDPFDCSGVKRYPFSEAVVILQNHGMVNDPDVDYVRSRSHEIGRQRIGRDLVRQTFDIESYLKNGKRIELIVINDASREECSAGKQFRALLVTELK